MIDSSIFKAYDVRGIYPSEINEEAAARIAKAFASAIRADKIVIGRDARESSPAIHRAVVDALMFAGVDVYDLGVCNTPLLNFAAVSKDFHGGIMISASHNPKEYNALKLLKGTVQLSSPGELDTVKKIALDPGEIKPVLNRQGSLNKLDVLNEYVTELAEHFVEVKNFKVVVDYANGMGSITAVPVFQKLGLAVIPLFQDIDCSFPNHHANPAEEKNLSDLRKRVVDEKADIGIFFDGDADRSFCIDEEGGIIYPDILVGIIAQHELKGMAEKKIYYDLRFSRAAKEAIEASSGTPIMMRVGNPFYKEKLINEGGIFAAELSGHVMFQDHYCIDDGLYAALKLMEVMAESKKKLSELAKPLRKYFNSPELNFKVKDADATLDKVAAAFSDGKSVHIDGVFIEYDDWWFSLRKSNTEPVVRLRLEANAKEKFEQMKEKIIGLIQQ